MGCALRKQERIYEDQALLAAQTHFSLEDVKSLTELLKKLSCSICNDGFISREEFQLGLFRDNIKHSLFSDRMFNLFDSNKDGLIDVGEFIRTLSIFHPDASQAEKIAGVWRVKLIINPQQLEEIFSEEGNTEALIEQMRIAANTSSIAKHTRSTSCGVNWKSTLPSVYKLPNEKQNKILALNQSSTSSPR